MVQGLRYFVVVVVASVGCRRVLLGFVHFAYNAALTNLGSNHTTS